MRDLSLVALHEDGESLVLEDAEGGRYSLPVDERLLSAVRGDRARLGQLSIELESSLRPAEIQARIRAGATAEEVAREAGVPLERVRRYEGPVVAEREHVARLARAALVGRRDGGERAPLADVVEPRLAQRGVPAEAVGWDAYRRDDGRWVVVVRWTTSTPSTTSTTATAAQGKAAAGRAGLATWLFDVRTRALSAGGDEARWLVDGEPAELVTETPPAAHPRTPEEFAERAYDEAPSDESPFPAGDPTPTGQEDRSHGQTSAPRSEDEPAGATVVGLDALLEAGSSGRRSRRSRRDRGSRPEPSSAAGADRRRAEDERDAPGRGEAVPAAEPAEPSQPSQQPEPEQPDGSGQSGRSEQIGRPEPTGHPQQAEGVEEPEQPEQPEVATGRAARPAAGGRGRRAAVPSWDEIVFGRKTRD
ncbi:MAG: septation protein SepH [Motilibacteraceae bacterium]